MRKLRNGRRLVRKWMSVFFLCGVGDYFCTILTNLQENNDIVKRAKNMSAMAFSMYQFTKGEGALKTTQDLFTQAEYFAEEANRLYKVIRQFSYQVLQFKLK